MPAPSEHTPTSMASVTHHIPARALENGHKVFGALPQQSDECGVEGLQVGHIHGELQARKRSGKVREYVSGWRQQRRAANNENN